MKHVNRVWAAAACGASLMVAERASAVGSTFDAGLEGWQAVGFDFDVVIGLPPTVTITKTDNSADLAWDAGGGAVTGNPGGFARFLDVIEEPASFLEAPAGFTGDLTGFAGGTLSYDHRLINEGSNATSVGPYVLALISGDPNDRNAYIALQTGPNLGDADTGWVNVVTTLDASNFESIVDVDLGLFDPSLAGNTASAFGIANGGMSFEQVLADVDSLIISFEMVDNNSTQVSEDDGVDNVQLLPVPEPSSLALLAAGGWLIARRRR